MPKIAKYTLDILMAFQDNWDTMNELAMNPDQIPNGNMEMIYNTAIGFNIINIPVE